MTFRVNRERIVDEFVRLTAFDSESYQEQDIMDYLKEELRGLGLQVEVDDIGNVYAFYPAYDPEDQYSEGILLSAHMDTVGPGIGKKAIIHEDGRITSDGTTVLGADDAAGLVEIIETLRILKEQKLPHPDIEVLFTVAEEVYARGSKVFDYSKIRSHIAYVLDMSGPVGRAAVAAPSIISLQIEVEGKSAHAGFCPEDGIHAIEIAAKAAAQIRNGHVDKGTTVNIGTIQGGCARNIVPDYCVITGEIRSMDHEKALEQASLIREIFDKEATGKGGSVKVEITEEFQSYRIQEQEPVVERFVQACKELGLSGDLEDTFGGSDNNHFAAHGIRGIVVANAMNEVHTTKEYTTKEELFRAAELTLKLVTM